MTSNTSPAVLLFNVMSLLLRFAKHVHVFNNTKGAIVAHLHVTWFQGYLW